MAGFVRENRTSSGLVLAVFVAAVSTLFLLYQQYPAYNSSVKEVHSSKKIAVLGSSKTETANRTENSPLPKRLRVPKINIDTDIEYVGMTDGGTMDVPGSSTTAGWWKLGVSPGERGSAVIAGHYNGENGNPGVFAELDKLKPGDNILVEDDKGKSVSFIVRESRIYKSGEDAPDVFGQKDGGSHLNLITCDGVWDEAQKVTPNDWWYLRISQAKTKYGPAYRSEKSFWLCR